MRHQVRMHFLGQFQAPEHLVLAFVCASFHLVVGFFGSGSH
jgi:hypothetical protein